MTEGTANHVANHMLESILRDLSFLKDNNFIPNQTYKDVVNILPSRIQETTTITTTAPVAAASIIESSKPPLPTRKSTMTPPKANSRELVASFPKLPVRRTTTNDWQQPIQPVAMVQQQPEPEKVAPAAPPPAYTQKPAAESLITVEALYDYQGEDPSTDLSFKQGNIIEVTEYVNDDWWKGTVNGKSGIFPQNHVKKVAPKPKRPWVPPTSAKPAFSTSSNTSSSPSYNNNAPAQPYNSTNQPYNYPPPPTAMYQPPPQLPVQSYGQQQQPVQSYGQPPPVANAVAATEEEGGDKKVHNMAKKFGGHVATAATWGFGATLGSQAANAIF
ncbi:hypothetical protein BDF21DRAFT_459179 [Thamnidium elegans]|uniref:SH3 domain-containing protein n=1 Tax=Thamnidium elegans TaxID=101142 RepID=A0A8H7VZL3_9FUNG|nr:hypothetical protein INT48_001052 [Thamnidium elegans]KAI8094809.1 hypothetical protein BDF21DRAFT_459179 [Thamnidium elegans]